MAVTKTPNNERVRQVRELKGWTQEELADRLKVDQSFVASVEAGRRPAPDSFIESLAIQSGFPVAYFYREAPPDFPMGSLLFRTRAATGLRERNRARRWAQVAFEFADVMLLKVTAPALRLPRLPRETAPRAAQLTRSALGLSPDTPIPQLIRSIERAGVLVILLPDPVPPGLDAFSGWAGNEPQRPVIALASNRPSDRMRMSIAHELAHLVRHQSVTATLAAVERDADVFAAEFLLPASRVVEEITCPVTLTSLTDLKPKWGVSLQFMIRRAHELGVVSPRQYRYLFEQISARGWRHCEPDSVRIPVERPRAFRELAELLYGIPIDTKKMAAAMDLRTTQVECILDGYAAHNGVPKNTRRPGTVLISPPVS